jgi:hypothetical protein
MSVRNTGPSLQRSRSALDHRGIDVAARLLVAGVRLERLFGNAPKILTVLAAGSGTHGPAAKVSRVSPHPRPFLREER